MGGERWLVVLVAVELVEVVVVAVVSFLDDGLEFGDDDDDVVVVVSSLHRDLAEGAVVLLQTNGTHRGRRTCCGRLMMVLEWVLDVAPQKDDARCASRRKNEDDDDGTNAIVAKL